MGNVLNSLPGYQLDEAARGGPQQIACSTGRCLLCAGMLEKCEDQLFDTRFGLAGKYEVCRCLACGLEQLFPTPEPAKLKSLYEQHYNFGGETDTVYTALRERFLFSFLYRLWTRIDGDVSFHLRGGAGRLLDIGCNEGRGLRMYARNGFNVEGLELNEAAASVAQRAGFVVHTDLLEKFDPRSPYDVAVLSNVLEHSLDPRRMLTDVHRILAPGGQVWISCPNGKSWLRRLFGKYWINWHVPFHISQFSTSILKDLLEETGFTGIDVQQVTPALWVAMSLLAMLFASRGRPTRELRNPMLIASLLLAIRFAAFPLLWVQNRRCCGDCLLAVARKA